MQPELIQPSWPLNPYFHEKFQENLDQSRVYGLNMDSYVGEDHHFSSSITSPEDCSVISSDSYFPSMLSNEFVELPTLDDEMQAILPIDGIETISGTAIDDMYRWLDESEEIENLSTQNSLENENSWSPSLSTKSSEASIEFQSMNSSIVLPEEDMEIDSQTGLCHLLKAYGEAMEMGERELASVIVGCINEKVSPVGETIERVAFNLFQSSGNQNDYIKQESRKNFEAAFKAFYEIFPYGRFAHFAANSAILEAIPNDVETVHIVDFDMGEGVQWPPMIEAIGHQRKALKLTSIKLEEQSCSFEETKKRLLNYARAFGVNLKVEEMGIGEFKNRGGEREWMAFNCMDGLPHMGRRRSRSQVMEFLRVAKRQLTMNKGIITFGDGEDGERMKNCSGYSSFFDGYLMHYQSIYESMEGNFPTYLTEARIAMESLFVAPYVSSLSWFQKWEQDREGSVLQAELGLEGRTLSKESLLEAKEMVKARETSYEIKIEGEKENEMVLEWRGTPLVRVSAWK